MPLSGDPFPRTHRGGQGTMDDAVEASAQRVRNPLRRPFPGGRNLLMETAGNTVSEIVPRRTGPSDFTKPKGATFCYGVLRPSYLVYFETAFSSVRAWSIWLYA